MTLTFNAESSQALAAYNWVAHYGDSATPYPLDTTDTTNPYVVAATSGGGDDSGSGTANDWSNDLTLNISEISSMDRLNVKPGIDFSTGSSGVSMPTTGNVTAFGIYNFDIDGNVRFDNFEVYVIPEPGSYMLIGISVAFLGLILRRRSHSRA